MKQCWYKNSYKRDVAEANQEGVCFEQRRRLTSMLRSLHSPEKSVDETYDAGVSATVTRHGTTLKWSSPQASDGWGCSGVGLRWGAERQVSKKKKDGKKAPQKQARHALTRTRRVGRFYASNAALGLASVAPKPINLPNPRLPSS